MKTESLEPLINKGFAAHRILLKLNRSRRFTRQIIEYSVNPTNFIDNSAHYFIKYFIRNLRCLSSHKIYRIHCTKCNCIIVSSLVTHNTNASHVGQGCKILSDAAVKSRVCNLFSINCICILYDPYFFSRYFSDDTDSKSRSREWLTEYKLLRKSKFKTCLADFIFEEITKWFNDFFEINILRKSSYVVMRLDYC